MPKTVIICLFKATRSEHDGYCSESGTPEVTNEYLTKDYHTIDIALPENITEGDPISAEISYPKYFNLMCREDVTTCYCEGNIIEYEFESMHFVRYLDDDEEYDSHSSDME